MNISRTGAGVTRRVFLALLLAGVGLFSWSKMKRKPIARAAPFVKPKEKWTSVHFHDFLASLPPDAMLALKKSLELLPSDAPEAALKGPSQDAHDVQKQALWLSSNILMYPFRDETKLNFHGLVTWVAKEAKVPLDIVQSVPTFALEHELQKLLFAALWDKLNAQQRKELLNKVDPNGTIKDKAAIAALGGAGALAALSATVAFAGFAFYTTMSVTIATVAGAVGVTLPFAAYTGASTLVGIFSGPVGWAIMGVAALGGVALAGRPNLRKTTALIGQMHALKVEALIAAGVPENEVFSH